jgi:1-acyl-sn-glycerol-3-phosphate acyltransferase
MSFVRALVFYIAFYGWTAGCTLLTLTTPFLSPARQHFPALLWSRGMNRLLRLVGIRVVERGRHSIPEKPCLFASKHQSAWETTTFFSILGPVAAVVKKELLGIPIFGWYLRRAGHIPVDRHGGDKALRDMVRTARRAVESGRSLVIFPEGTRVPVGAKKDYLPGVYALYNLLKIEVVPIALNSGVFWPRRAFAKRPGTIVLEFLAPIPPGLGREDFMARLRGAIEPATGRLVAEARGGGA